MTRARWKTAAVTVTAGALLATGSGVAHADRGQDAGTADGPTRTARGPVHSGPPKVAPAAGAKRPAAGAAASRPTAAVAESEAINLAEVASPAAGTAPAPVAVTVPAPKPTPAKATPAPVKLFGDGTAASPNAGLLWGNGFSYDASTCPSGSVCNGGNAGKLFGDGGSGWNGGNGGNGGAFGRHITYAQFGFFGIPTGLTSYAGAGGDAAVDCTTKGITCNGGNGGNGPTPGNGGNGGPGGNGGNGGNVTASRGTGGTGGNGGIGGNGGNGGSGGWLFGVGGNGGNGGPGGKGGLGAKGSPLARALAGISPFISADGKNGEDGIIGAAASGVALKSAKATSPGKFPRLFGDGTAEHPDAGLIAGNGYSWAPYGECPSTKVCDGGKAGLLWGDGGAGANGGKGGDGGLFGTHLSAITLGLFFGIPLGFYGKGGDGGRASETCQVDGITCNGGDGGNASRFALGAVGGDGGDGNAAFGGVGGRGGRGGLLGPSGTDGLPTP